MKDSAALEGLVLMSVIAAVFLCLHKQQAAISSASKALGSKKGESSSALASNHSSDARSGAESPAGQSRISIFYGTTTGSARKFATTLEHHLRKKFPTVQVQVVDMKDYSDEQLDKEDIAFFILSTWEGGKPPPSCAVLLDTIDDMAHDFRVSKSHLSNMRFAVFGLGTADYGSLFCKAAKTLDANLFEMGAQRLLPLSTGDDSQSIEQAFYRWSSTTAKAVADLVGLPSSIPAKKDKKSAHRPSGAASSKAAASSAPPASSGCGTGSCGPTSCGSSGDADNAGDVDVDIEDLINDAFVDTDGSIKELPTVASADRREMVTALQRQALTKEGYKIIGTHSAVKLCRWTKHQLRGRGGCYKHSFYGITSYQCMEATPSLACANKCVFCWRHHKNPVGTEWRWKEDSPEEIVSQAIAYHVQMIHGMKGVPGVVPERFEEAHTVRHCALSLVGEPIMYPRINEMLYELHRRDISSFLVTNAQFPERIEQLDPVTQLYVSIDAASKEALKAIDRPLFKDFWERYLACLNAIRKRAQRTVYRMTLVKDWNMTEMEGYAQLVERGLPGKPFSPPSCFPCCVLSCVRTMFANDRHPCCAISLADFIEIKAVTYCGKSDASSLTMQNVPWHDEVCQYAQHLCDTLTSRGLCGVTYSIATEHQHSCCILIAREDKFKRDGHWHTWIDYPKFHALMRDYYASNKQSTFRSEDYCARTPDWAVYQSKERGFDPEEVRWKRGEKNSQEVDPTLIPDPSESGCG